MCEGFGYYDDINKLDTYGEVPGIYQDQYQTVMVKPLCGLFSQAIYLPLRYMPIEPELELADWDAPVIIDFSSRVVIPEGGVAEPDKNTALNKSTSWRIQNCQIKWDILSLDNSLDNSYVNHLLGGNTLKLVYDTYVSSVQTITCADTQVNVSRALTSLRIVCMSLDKTFTEGRIKWCNKSWNTFYSIMAGNRSAVTAIKDINTELEHLQLMVGSKVYPECRMLLSSTKIIRCSS